VGERDDYTEKYGVRREIFDIAQDEQLIGCKLEYSKSYFEGVTWFKMKICD
jgi:hypothetical protein